MPLEVQMEGGFQPIILDEPLDHTLMTMNTAAVNGKVFFVSENIEGNRVAVYIPRIISMVEVDGE